MSLGGAQIFLGRLCPGGKWDDGGPERRNEQPGYLLWKLGKANVGFGLNYASHWERDDLGEYRFEENQGYKHMCIMQWVIRMDLRAQ